MPPKKTTTQGKLPEAHGKLMKNYPTKHPRLVVAKMQRLPKEAGIHVRIGLSPNKKANYTTYQNVDMSIGSTKYRYSEAWSMGSKNTQYDYFQVPQDLRNKVYRSDVVMWLEPGGIDKTYKEGKAFDAKSPWGTAHGRDNYHRTPPDGAGMLRRITVLKWDSKGKLLEPKETRKFEIFAG